MNKKSIIWVAYDTSKTDLSCVVCTEPNNGRAKMRVGYTGESADELYKIVYEQGYLAEHDKEVRNKTIEEVIETYLDVICDDCSKCGEICRHDDVMDMLNQMKEGT